MTGCQDLLHWDMLVPGGARPSRPLAPARGAGARPGSATKAQGAPTRPSRPGVPGPDPLVDSSVTVCVTCLYLPGYLCVFQHLALLDRLTTSQILWCNAARLRAPRLGAGRVHPCRAVVRGWPAPAGQVRAYARRVWCVGAPGLGASSAAGRAGHPSRPPSTHSSVDFI